MARPARDHGAKLLLDPAGRARRGVRPRVPRRRPQRQALPRRRDDRRALRPRAPRARAPRGGREWDTALVVAHGAVNRAILSYALTGERMFLGRFEQAPGCLNVLDVGDDWVVRAVNVAPGDLVHRSTRLTQMEQYWRSTDRTSSRNERGRGIAPAPVFLQLPARRRTHGSPTWSPPALELRHGRERAVRELAMRSHATAAGRCPTCAAGCRAAGTG